MTDTALSIDEGRAVRTEPQPPIIVRRHRWPTRLWHWVNAVTLLIMLMSGLTIFNAHPRLYWGAYGANQDHAWLQIGASEEGGYLRVGSLSVETTGVLGRWTNAAGVDVNRAFPSWATIPSGYNLAVARHWHLFFAWFFAGGLALYGLWSLASRHLTRDLLPTRAELSLAHILHDIGQHARLRFPRGEAARRYNVLQSLPIAACCSSFCRRSS